MRWTKETNDGDKISRYGVWDLGSSGPVWTANGTKFPRPHPMGWVSVSGSSEIMDESGDPIMEATLYGATVDARAIDVNASGAIAIAGDFEGSADLPGCTLLPTGELTSFVAVFNPDLTLRHARVLGTARAGPASTWSHNDIPTNRIRDVYIDDAGGVWLIADVQLPIAWDGHTIEPTSGTPQCSALGGDTDSCIAYDRALLKLSP